MESIDTSKSEQIPSTEEGSLERPYSELEVTIDALVRKMDMLSDRWGGATAHLEFHGNIYGFARNKEDNLIVTMVKPESDKDNDIEKVVIEAVEKINKSKD